MEQASVTIPRQQEPSWFKAYYVLLVVILIGLFQPGGGTWAWLHDIRWLYVLLISFIFSQLLTPLVIRLAWFFKILDHPDPRKIHVVPIPRLGGLAIFASFLFSTARNYHFSRELTGLVIGGSIIYVIGLMDDIRPLPARFRLLAQLVAALVVIGHGVVLTVIPLSVPGHGYISVLITIVWLIGFTNALNFMDGVDGLATSMTMACALFFFLIAWPTRQSYLAYVTIAIFGASMGFLPYNWKRARIFLGDAGSTFLGFMLAGLAVMGYWANNDPVVAVSTPLLIMSIPIFDMIYTTVSRIKNGSIHTFKEWLEFAGKDHFHHRLMFLGLSETQTVIFIIMVNLCLGLGALALRYSGATESLLLLLQSLFFFLIIIVLMLLGRHIYDDGIGNKDTKS
jgi:UDP-GlcNAc:undecaprenyl-phosphate GlcNAc-1-phosphate transferase